MFTSSVLASRGGFRGHLFPEIVLTLLTLFKCIVLSRLDYVHSYGVHTKLNLSIRLNQSKDLSPSLLLECDADLMMRG